MGITPQQLKRIEERLSRPSRSPRPVCEPSQQTQAGHHEVILGVDPSLRGTGYGVIRVGRPSSQALDYGTISCPSEWEHSRCLVKIAHDLREVLKRHRPTACVMEGIFFAQNLRTAIIMGEARGAAISAVGEAG